MLDMDFESDIHAIIKKLPKKRTNLMFSATYSGKIQNLTKISENGCEILKIGQDDVKTAENLIEMLVICLLAEKTDYLVYLLKKHACRCIVFATRVCDV